MAPQPLCTSCGSAWDLCACFPTAAITITQTRLIMRVVSLSMSDLAFRHLQCPEPKVFHARAMAGNDLNSCSRRELFKTINDDAWME